MYTCEHPILSSSSGLFIFRAAKSKPRVTFIFPETKITKILNEIL
jgi:hypothetical protein